MSKLRWHLGHLDSLRGIAVLGVVLVHSYWRPEGVLHLPRLVGDIAMSGQRGVALFFLVSAFTLFLSNDNRKDEARPTINFFIRRFFRLSPMLYVSLCFTYVFYPAWFGPLRYGLLAAFYINGFHPIAITSGAPGGWSVAIEAMFYFCLPLLFARIKTLKTSLIWLFIGTPLAYEGSRILSEHFPQHAPYFQFFSFTVEYPIFLLGITGYFIWKEVMPSIIGQKQLSIMLLGMAAMFYRSLLPFTNVTLYQSSLVCLLLLLALSLYPWKILVNTVTRFLGRISYSIYLLHGFVVYYLHRFADRAQLRPWSHLAFCFCGTVLIVTPLSYATWRWIEEPGIRLGRSVIARLERRNAPRKDTELFPSGLSATAEGNSPDAQF